MKEKSAFVYLLGLLNFNLIVFSIVITILLSNVCFYIDGLSSEYISNISAYIPQTVKLALVLMVIFNGAVTGFIIYALREK